MSDAKTKEHSPPTVAFRLNATLHELLSQAAERCGQSPNEYARTVLVQSLQNELPLEVLDRLNRLQSDQTQLRSAIAMALEAVLLNTTDLDEDRVAAWIRKKIIASSERHTARDGGTPC